MNRRDDTATPEVRAGGKAEVKKFEEKTLGGITKSFDDLVG